MVAVAVLAVFFWLTVRQPALAFVAVAPTVLVLTSVLGTMALLDIPYTIITSIITAALYRNWSGLHDPPHTSLP